MERKLTPEEGEAIQKERDRRRTLLLREFCRRIAELPEDFSVGSGLTEEMLQKHFEPMANEMYVFMKENGMTIQDIQYMEPSFKTIFGFTLEKTMHFAEALIQNALLKHFGVSNIVNDLSLQELENEGLVRIDPKDLETTGVEPKE